MDEERVRRVRGRPGDRPDHAAREPGFSTTSAIRRSGRSSRTRPASRIRSCGWLETAKASLKPSARRSIRSSAASCAAFSGDTGTRAPEAHGVVLAQQRVEAVPVALLAAIREHVQVAQQLEEPHVVGRLAVARDLVEHRAVGGKQRAREVARGLRGVAVDGVRAQRKVVDPVQQLAHRDEQAAQMAARVAHHPPQQVLVFEDRRRARGGRRLRRVERHARPPSDDLDQRVLAGGDRRAVAVGDRQQRDGLQIAAVDVAQPCLGGAVGELDRDGQQHAAVDRTQRGRAVEKQAVVVRHAAGDQHLLRDAVEVVDDQHDVVVAVARELLRACGSSSLLTRSNTVVS